MATEQAVTTPERSQQAHAAIEGAEETVRSGTERVAAAAHEAIDRLTEYGEAAETRLREGSRVAGERSQEWIEQATEYIDQHPMAAIGIALGAGFVLGMLARRGISQPE